MGKMTFVVDYPNGQEPAVSADSDIFGGKLLSVSFKDLTHDNDWRTVSDIQPKEGKFVIVHNGDYPSVGRLMCGEWRDSEGFSYLSPVTHWLPLPEL